MKRIAPLLLALVCAGCPNGGPPTESPPATGSPAATASPASEGGDPSGAGKPEETFERAKACFEAKDWKGYLDCMTPESQRVNVLGFVQVSTMVVDLQKSMNPSSDAQAKLDAIYEKHGTTAADAEAKLSKDAAGIDLAGLFSDLKAFLEIHSGEGGFDMGTSIGSIREVKIEGEQATAVHVIPAQGEDRPEDTSTMEFRKVAGRWLLHMEPPGK